MKTELHLKLEKLCRILIKKPKHWFIKGSSVMWMSELNEHVSVKRAIYAAFVEDVPGNMEVRATKCEASRCVNPEHCSLVPARGTSNQPLSLPWHRDQLALPKKFVPPTPKGKLPVGMTPDTVEKVKTMVKAGSTLAQVQLVTKLSLNEIVLIKNGTYDRAAGRVRRESEKRVAALGEKKGNYLETVNKTWDQEVDAVFPLTLIAPKTLTPEITVEEDSDDLSNVGRDSAEQIWLAMMRNK